MQNLNGREIGRVWLKKEGKDAAEVMDYLKQAYSITDARWIVELLHEGESFLTYYDTKWMQCVLTDPARESYSLYKELESGAYTWVTLTREKLCKILEADMGQIHACGQAYLDNKLDNYRYIIEEAVCKKWIKAL